jgi:hypothetical protein
MGKQKNKNLHLLAQEDIRKIKKLVRILEKALVELVELKRVTTFDDERNHYTPHASDLIEEQSYLEYQLEFFPTKTDF